MDLASIFGNFSMGNCCKIFVYVSLYRCHVAQLVSYFAPVYVAESIYTIALGLIKVSLCMFYLEVFPLPRLRIVCYIITGWIITNTVVIFLLTIFSCLPVASFWNKDIKGKCLDINALAYANSACAIAQDIVLVIFPLACIRNLNMKRYRKFAVGFMFSIGTLYVPTFYSAGRSNIHSGCVTTIIRLHTLLAFGNSIDPTWDYIPAAIWTELELASGFVCASLPAVRILFVLMVPKSLITSITSRSKSRSNGSSNPGIGSSNSRKQERKRLSWMHISTNDDSTALEESRYRTSKLWPDTVSRYSPRSRSHQRLSSGLGYHEEFNMSHVQTFTSPVPQDLTAEEVDQVLELPSVHPSLRRKGHICYSCGTEDEIISALPRIGCLPDESFEKDEEWKGGKAEGRWWEEVRRSMERSRCGLGEKGPRR
jgi:hypothetical protein